MNYFFQIPEVKQQGEALRIQMLSGIPSELLFEQQPMEQNVLHICISWIIEYKAVSINKGSKKADS